MLEELEWAEGKGFVALVGMQLIAHFLVNRADKAEEEGMQMFARGEARWNGRFG